MSVLLDTNIAIYLRDGNAEIQKRATAFEDTPSISIVTRIELEAGVAAKPLVRDIRRLRTDELLAELRVFDFDIRTADAYREILHVRGYARSKVFDRMIAATAIVHGLTLITINADDFRDIPGLDLEVWAAPAQ